MYKKVFNLEQITPMWHFQGDDPNCCLRATEVKPKLDKFIIKSLGEDNIPADWWIDKEHNSALNYKMRISCDSARTRTLPDVDGKGKNIYPIFFANMGDNQGQHKTLVMFSGVVISITSMVSGLLRYISESVVDDFFAAHSFGTRQDKGFGCFQRVGCDAKHTMPSNACFYFLVPDGRNNNIKDTSEQKENKMFSELFKHINCFHRIIRSGINEPGKTDDNDNVIYPDCYVKSMMYHYVHDSLEQGSVWDKPVIRSFFQFENHIYRYIYSREDRPDMAQEYRNHNSLITKRKLYRDALGLSTAQEWVKYKDKIYIEQNVRFKSPIEYHPVRMQSGKGFIVYIILGNVPDDIPKLSFGHVNGTEKLENMRVQPIDLNDYFQYILEHHATNEDLIRIDGIENQPPFSYIKQILGPNGTFNKIQRNR